ncbi:helix-turn-helix transcriptional regulator [Streptomyces sp. NBRC 109706]|uniref:ArsR/SmtB family transcription factor n=1 Tax=Streptomyces sp. NBRC 109706 TaxID=1550035 RepID=UPI000780A0EE|nr:metalloregulator ArsR/SmtB family transcription factor [Streptomyces sp. NBRC 109706]
MNAPAHPRPPVASHHGEPSPEQYARAADVLTLLADRTRLVLLHTLSAGEADVTALTTACGAARPAVSQHLAKLRLGGLVTTRKEGRRVVYTLRNSHIARLVDEALGHADHDLTETAPRGASAEELRSR